MRAEFRSASCTVATPASTHTAARTHRCARVSGFAIAGTVECSVRGGTKKYAYAQIDGQVQIQVPVGGRIVLRPAATRFRHLGLGPQHFFQVLHAKFGFTGVMKPRG